MKKANLNKKQAEAFDWLRGTALANERIIEIQIEVLRGADDWVKHNEILKDLTLDTLIRAVYIGYEVEQTEQEKIQELFRKKGSYNSCGYISGYELGMEETLKALGREDLIQKLKEE